MYKINDNVMHKNKMDKLFRNDRHFEGGRFATAV